MDWKKANSENLQFFQPEDDKKYQINIIPFEIKTKNHPLVASGDYKVGDLDYGLDVWVHRSIGPSEKDVVCLKNTYGRPCPICEEADNYRRQGEKENSDALRASRRVYYNIIELGDDDAGLKIFSASHYLFEHELIQQAKRDGEGKQIVPFADLEDGKVVEFWTEETKKGKMKFIEFSSFRFNDRKKPVNEKLVDEAISFDELLIYRNADEVKEVLFGEEIDEEPEDGKDEKKSSSHKKGDEETEKSDDDSDDRRFMKGECPSDYDFGTADEHKECKTCEAWDKCMDKKEADAKAKRRAERESHGKKG
jgi:hypothetical protein